MRGARLLENGVVEVRDNYPEPVITDPNQVKIRVKYCAVNADDYSTYCGLLGKVYSDDGLFHEMSGEIVEAGAEAERAGFQIGQRVSRNILQGCGNCPACRSGMSNLCSERLCNGASSEYYVCNINSVVKLPDSIDYEEGSLYWLVSTCTRCIEKLDIKPGNSVLVLGGGATGIMLLQLVMKRMPSIVMVSEPIQRKRKLALQLGADIAIDPNSESLVAESLKATEGQGFDVIIDAMGVCSALANIPALLARGGKLMLFSNYGISDHLSLNLMDMYFKEVSILTSFGVSSSSYTAMTAGTLHHLNIKSIIDDILPLEEVQKALNMYGTGQYFRLLIRI